MNKILCVIGKELSSKNEKYILQYDNSDTQIELFTNAITMGLSIGKLRTLSDQIYTSDKDMFYFFTDIKQLYTVIKNVYADLFTDVRLCPATDEAAYPLYSIYEEKVSENFRKLLNRISNLKAYFYCHRNKELGVKAETYWSAIEKEINALTDAEQKLLYHWLEEYSQIFNEDDRLFYFYCLSILLDVTKKPKYVEALYHEVHEANYTVDHCFFLFQQLKRYFLLNGTALGREWMEELYEEIRQAWTENCSNLTVSIPAEERNRDRIAIIVLQFLGKRHAPTKTAMERIETIIRLGKEVLVIHSAEQLTQCGELPFWKGMIGNIDHTLDGMNRVEGNNGCIFPMYQPLSVMPDYVEIQKILTMIRQYSPYKVIVLGDHCLLGDLVAEMIPTVCIPMTFSTIPEKYNQFVAVGKHLTQKDYEYIKSVGCDPERYIESTFTFELIPQTTCLTRRQLSIPEDKFVLAIVGIRLDHEVTEEFIRGIQKVFEHDCYIAFAGTFESYMSMCEKLPQLGKNSTYVGYQDDILALEEVCDLYVNPPRVGGGFSVVEAFYKGKPAVTLPYGDVAASAGPDFWVEDLQEMENTILRYKEDSAFYQSQAKRALERGKELFDSEGALQHILDEMERREEFF